MLSNKLTFSLASLVMLIALGLVFAPMSVMAHDLATGHVPDPAPDGHMHPMVTISSAEAGDAMGTVGFELTGDPLAATFDLEFTFDVEVTAVNAALTFRVFDSGGDLITHVASASNGSLSVEATALDDDDDTTNTVADSMMYTSTITITDQRDTTDATPDPAIALIEVTLPAGTVANGSGSVEINPTALTALPTFGIPYRETKQFLRVAAPYEADTRPAATVSVAADTYHGGGRFNVTVSIPHDLAATPPVNNATTTISEADIDAGSNARVLPGGVNDVASPAAGMKQWTVTIESLLPTNMADIVVTIATGSKKIKAATMNGSVTVMASDPEEDEDAAAPMPGTTTIGGVTGMLSPMFGVNTPFIVIGRMAGAANTGIDPSALTDTTVTPAESDYAAWAGLPDLEEFFRVGGTLEVLVSTGTTAPADLTFVVTEIMWGLDASSTAAQWIEVYENVTTTKGFQLFFTDDEDVNRTTAGDYTVVDRVSTLHLAKWNLPGNSGNTDPEPNPSTGITPDPTNLVSAYRKNDLDAAGTGYKDATFAAGNYADSWAKSERRINMTGSYVGTPNHVHRAAAVPAATAVPSSAAANISVVFNEVRNATDDTYDFIELYNHGSSGVNLKDWEITIVKPDKTDTDLIDLFPGDYTLGSKEILLILNTDPRGDSIDFNEGIDQDEDPKDRVERGAQHKYIVRDFALPNGASDTFMLVLRNHQGKNSTDEHIQDLAGYIAVADTAFNTEVWPLKGWKQPGAADRDNFGANSFRASKTWNRKDYAAKAWWHKDAWADVGNEGGIGYRREAAASNAIGTPGYARDSRKGKIGDYNTADANAEITISEIMYDDGSRGNTAQWIELYNSSFTNTVNLKDWYLEVVNHEAADAYVDEKIQFKTDLTILPNQTVLIVSGNGVNNVAEKYVYSLFQHHRRDLSLTTRKSTLLNPEGFHITLSDKDDVMVDTAGNLRSSRNLAVEWELPTLDGRQSIVRIYGVQMPDGDKVPDLAEPGTMESSWAVSTVGGLSYYGHRDDMGTPGYRDGGPLPVSLSSFRPARDKATGAVVIRWITQSELNNAGFNILRSETKNGEFKVVNTKGIIPGHGTTSEKHVYTWTDTTAKPNVVYYYQIEDVSLDGKRTTLRTTHLRGNVNAAGKLTTIWGDLKTQN